MSENKVFESEQAMLQQLEAMGMPRQMLQNLTDEQKKAMFAMTQSPQVQARAAERAAHEEDWKLVASEGYQWKNTRDDVFVKFQGITDGKVTCDIQPNHIKITTADDKTLLDRQLFQTVNVTESSWEVKGDTLAVCLRKEQAPMRWLSLHR